VAVAAGAGAGACAAPPDGAVVAAAPVGAGADAAVVAGRLAQPANSAVLTTNVATRNRMPPVTMTPPLAQITWTSQRRSIVSRQSRGPRGTGRLRRALRHRCLRGAVSEHGEDLPSAEAARLEHEMPSVRRPRRALVVAGPVREAARIRAVGVDGPDVVGARALRVD